MCEQWRKLKGNFDVYLFSEGDDKIYENFWFFIFIQPIEIQLLHLETFW